MQEVHQTKGLSRKRTIKSGSSMIRQEIISRLDKFFAGVPYTVSFESRMDGKIGASVTYTDFFSERLVGQMMEGLMPDGVCLSLKREYSDKAVVQVLLQEYKRNKVAVVDCYNGELRPETIHDFVGRKLDGVEMV